KGRLACVGSLIRRDRARALALPAMSTAVRQFSAPPAMTTSERPWRIHSEASPIASAPVAQALLIDRLGPPAPKCRLISTAALSMAPVSGQKGLIALDPRAWNVRTLCSMERTEPYPLPINTP